METVVSATSDMIPFYLYVFCAELQFRLSRTSLISSSVYFFASRSTQRPHPDRDQKFRPAARGARRQALREHPRQQHRRKSSDRVTRSRDKAPRCLKIFASLAQFSTTINEVLSRSAWVESRDRLLDLPHSVFVKIAFGLEELVASDWKILAEKLGAFFAMAARGAR